MFPRLAAVLALVVSLSTWGREDASCPHYKRQEQFGRWSKSGCRDTRADLLVVRSLVPTTGDCAVKEGQWTDPYTDSVFTLARNLQIDHVVPLDEAYKSGAYAWTDEERRTYAENNRIIRSRI